MRALLLVLALFAAACGQSGSQLDPPDAGIPPVNPGPGDKDPKDGGADGEGDAGADAGTETDGGTGEEDGGAAYTWYRDVLPIVQDNCQGCHAPGGIAPFTLTSYADGFAHHLAMADAVVQRRMPPWIASDTCAPLKGSRLLAQADIDVLSAWSQAGAPEGDPGDAPPPPMSQPGLAWVDATLDPGVDYTPNGAVTDDYRCFILPPAFAQQEDVIGFEVLPGTPNQVHHVILFHAPAASAQANDDAETGPGWTCYGGPGISQSEVRMIGGWVPGTGATALPENTGVQIPSGQVIVMQVHYNLQSGALTPDRTKVRLQFSPTPVQKPALLFPIVDDGFTIPPQSVGYASSATFTIPSFLGSATLYGTTPHMHQLGRRIRVTNASTGACLIDIPRWDFHWQQPYQFQTPLTVLAGQTFEIECTWDNPTTQAVTWGEGTQDEMCVAFFYATFP